MPKVFDSCTLFNELDLLELRFEILNNYVDKFILVESHQTFSGHEKPLYYEENKKRFAKWNDKIIHIVVPNMAVHDGDLFRRHYLCYEAMENKLLEIGKPEDISFVGDLDEIWNPAMLDKVDDNPHILEQRNYSYWLNYLSNEGWTGNLMTKVKNIMVGFHKVHMTGKPFPLKDGGWHFSNMGGAEAIIKKLEAYDHSNEILPSLSQFEGYGVQERMDKGYDFLGRPLNYQGVPYVFTVTEDKWPEYLKENRQQYLQMIK